MKTSPRGVQFIARHEGLRLTPYEDSNGYCTVGYGHLIRTSRCTFADKPISQTRALELLAADLAEAEHAVNELVKPPFRYQYRYDACVSFVFNVGVDAFASSSFLQALNHSTLRGKAVWEHILAWVHDSRGNVIPGLVNRRRDEFNLALHRKYS